jgi:hypothetical protein
VVTAFAAGTAVIKGAALAVGGADVAVAGGAAVAAAVAHPVTASAVAASASAPFFAHLVVFCAISVTPLFTESSSNGDDRARAEVAAVTIK